MVILFCLNPVFKENTKTVIRYFKFWIASCHLVWPRLINTPAKTWPEMSIKSNVTIFNWKYMIIISRSPSSVPQTSPGNPYATEVMTPERRPSLCSSLPFGSAIDGRHGPFRSMWSFCFQRLSYCATQPIFLLVRLLIYGHKVEYQL